MAAYKWQNIQRRIKTISNPIGVEVGVFRGELSVRLLQNIPELTLFMVDLWSPKTYCGKCDQSVSEIMRNEYEKNYIQNYEYVQEITEPFYERAIILQQDSLIAAAQFKNQYFDFVFLDAGHSHDDVKADIFAWYPKIKKGGWICGHDYNNFPGVNKAVDEIFKGKAEIDSDYTWFFRL